jgi:hypothetical protein
MPAFSDWQTKTTAITRYRRSLSVSLMMSLLVHIIIAGTLAYSSNDRRTHSNLAPLPARLFANLAYAKHRPVREPAPLTPKSYDRATEKLVAPQLDTTLPEATADTDPYAPPDSIEQMASVISPPDLPLPTDPNSPFGFMRIKVFVNEDGLADSVELLESNFAQDYASTLVERFKLARFNPGVSGGKAIKSWRIVEIDYSSS